MRNDWRKKKYLMAEPKDLVETTLHNHRQQLDLRIKLLAENAQERILRIIDIVN